MDSPQSVVSPFCLVPEPEKSKSDFFVRSSSDLTKVTQSNGKDIIGVLHVYIHQARDIQNICIYHKQDVYAKLCLTSDPENTVSSKTINGGGRNPVFNDSLWLNVRTVESSFKCEIFMTSRVKNYLEDQLLGFALVPLSEVMQNGKLEKEFSLSSTDVFHSPASFVQLSLAYSGASPDVMAIPTEKSVKYSGITDDSLDKTEFPDPQVVNENQMMVSEYYGIQCDLNSESSESFIASCSAFQLQRLNKRNSIQQSNGKDIIGVLHVYVHQARDIQNICIYHKQDVYAKLCLTSDPENTVSSKTINGGGRNPVFNDSLWLNVRTVKSSLKCEIFMMSRVKNYLEDQLLGFALVPLSEVMQNGKLEKEFSLLSTDVFHSPAGFVQLSLAYSGASPDVMAIPTEKSVKYSGITDDSLDKTEFPDPQVVNENQMMVSEYYGIQYDLNSESSESLAASDNDNNYEMGICVVESFSSPPADSVKSFSTATADSVKLPKLDSPPSSVSINGDSTHSAPATSDSSDVSKTPNEEHISPLKEKSKDVGDNESDSSGGVPKPVVKVNIEPEQNMVQQDIVDMYMKSMQQFTESLTKMKLPLDIDSGPTSSGSSSSDQKVQSSSKNSGSRVFYGSRAFF